MEQRRTKKIVGATIMGNMGNESKKPEQKPLPPSKPDYVTKSPTLLPPQHPTQPQTRVEGSR